LCAMLGLALYLAAEAFASTAGRNAAVLWLALALSLGLSFWSIPAALKAWRTGVLPSKTGMIERDKDPVFYWSLMALEGAANAGLLALSAYCAWRLLTL
ncbi:MAG: hypothetical protein Q8M31_07410, partial [Beijerinckiaceae bacterium]|nr:hypothetical protein [Beijerinckiaceae bacterium]